ncbi:Nin one binding Zn-ribbon like-domain-containing protein [Panaeolus papilionaceus]|nr:Nin one binding Zn-ribbon like-domain-containing protein [Panaeolus papilionaceus]
MSTDQKPQCKRLVLDAGPLLSLSPLRGLAETYLTTPEVLSELKDGRAREHFERLGLMSGVKVEIKSPDPAALSHDYSVLSHADLCILALTYRLHEEDKKAKESEAANQASTSATTETTENPTETEAAPPTDSKDPADLTQTLENLAINPENTEPTSEAPETAETVDDSNPIPLEESSDAVEEDGELEPLDVELTPIKDDDDGSPQPVENEAGSLSDDGPIYEDPSDSDDGEGEWITPSNVGLHKSKALDLLPADNVKGKTKADPIGTGCMTADFAMQNVLLQMGLNLVGLEGKRIEKVKNWVLRCHACFKQLEKILPICGNPTLIRASVTISSPNASSSAPVMQVHLKPNFQYKIRGTKYSIPLPKSGSAKTGPGTGLILREDQVEYMRAKKRADGKRQKEEERLLKGILSRGMDVTGANAGVSSWMDPDWVPGILSVGSGGKGRTAKHAGMDGDMPQIGYGRKNPNQARKKK